MPTDPNELWPKLEELGEEEVRRKLTLGDYGDRKRPTVEAWLQSKEANRRAQENQRDYALRVEEVAAAKGAKNAAWAAAGAAWLAAILSAIFAWLASRSAR
jgi:hypothetical protein